MPTWTLHTANASDIDEVVALAESTRTQLFPKLAGTAQPADLEQFQRTYLEGGGCFIVARDQGRLVAMIGYRPYDHRFAQFDYRQRRTVEVVRLFVEPAYRRAGLAAALFAALRQAALDAGVACLYLHTHPFLPGAIAFWQRQGFHITGVDPDPDWQTTHMFLQLQPE